MGIKEYIVMSEERNTELMQTLEQVALRCARELGLSAVEIARHVGVNTSAVTRAINRAVRKTEQSARKEY